MKLNELDDVFGIPMPVIKTQATRYNLAVLICSVLDIVIILIAGILLYKFGRPSEAMEVSVLVGVFVNMLLLAVVKEDSIEAVRFFRSHKNDKVSVKSYDVDADGLFSALFSSGYKGAKSGLSFDAYTEMLNSACLRRNKYAKKLYKCLQKYESEEGQFCAYVSDKGYYVAVREGEK